MSSRRRMVLPAALALAGLLVVADTAAAWWHGPVYRQRTVIRGGGAVVPGGGIGGAEFFPLVPRAEFGYGYGFGREFGLREMIQAEFARAEAGRVSNQSTGGAAPATPAAGTADLSARLTRVEDRLKELTTRVEGVERTLAAMREERARAEQMEALRALVRQEVTEQNVVVLLEALRKQRTADKQVLGDLFREVLREKRDPAAIEALLKKLADGQ